MEDKIGKKPYLGIVIDYDKEKNLDKFSLDTLKDRYFWEDETHMHKNLLLGLQFLQLLTNKLLTETCSKAL